MFKELLPSVLEEEIQRDLLIERTEGYSGSDIRLVCKEAAMHPLRRLILQLEEKHAAEEGMDVFASIIILYVKKAILISYFLADHPPVGPVTWKDVEVALKSTRPSAHLYSHRYEKFNEDYGSLIFH